MCHLSARLCTDIHLVQHACDVRLTGRGECIITDVDWNAIFAGFDDVYRFQHRLLQELEMEWNSQLAAVAAEKLKPPEGVCYKQKPTLRTWPARYVRIEGKSFNV